MASPAPLRSLPRALRRSRWSHTSHPQRRQNTTAAIAVEYEEPAPAYYPPPPTETPSAPRKAIKEAKPFSDFLTDTFARQHNYLRISLTERCNLRCLYCMPEEGVPLQADHTQLTTAEIHYLSALFVSQGVNKIRLTGGEPTVRKDILPLMQGIGDLRSKGLKELALTTNGISLHRKLEAMVEAGLTGVNISLDTLDPFQFTLLTRRNGFEAVQKSINRVLELNKHGAAVKLKVNIVVMRGLNDDQILPFVNMTRDEDIEVRFIEYMPFGGNKWSQNKMYPYQQMLDRIRTLYPSLQRLKGDKNDTSKTFHVPGFAGKVGFITSMTHNFCGSCNRLRITSDGNLKVCLFGNAEVSLRDLLRKENGGVPMDDEAFEAVRQIELDRRRAVKPSFDTPGGAGWLAKEQELLQLIGAAVKRKKEKHAGMGELENMQNRPMILIDEPFQNRRRTSTSRLPISRPRMPWSSIPTHLILPQISTIAHTRSYSTNNKSDFQIDSAHQPGSGPVKERSKENGSLAETFGFQSLSGLFYQQQPAGRYSRPREAPAERVVPQTVDESRVRQVQHSVDGDFFRQSNEVAGKSTRSGSGRKTKSRQTPSGSTEDEQVAGYLTNDDRPGSYDDSATSSRARARETSVPTTRRARMGQPRIKRYAVQEAPWADYRQLKLQRGNGLSRTRNPFALGEAHPPLDGKEDSESEESGWGLPALNDITDSSAQQGTRAPAVHETSESTTAVTSPPGLGATLTHLTATGDAHMVDIGSKSATKRTAIAFAYVRFSNPDPVQLISENSNKKGDVLGVARIAGIMAAKRTSDLIPLCHPIPISRVEVEVRPVAPSVDSMSWSLNKHGLVAIEAIVQCTGPTGVEMEALTATSAAALTVYDMCKAADKSMRVEGLRMVYKDGGRTGLYQDRNWKELHGPAWFESRGLRTSWQRDDS